MSTCMSEGRSLYRLDDPAEKNKKCTFVKDFTEATYWNGWDDSCKSKGKRWGIFWTVNGFNGPRKKENCVRVMSWYVDLDRGTKAEQRSRIKDLRLEPSAVVESKAGHHVYYDAKGVDPDPDAYRGLIERMNAGLMGDNNAKDICRILRVPGFVHWKDPNNPVAVKLVFASSQVYTEKTMNLFFPKTEKFEKFNEAKASIRRELKFQGDESLTDLLSNLDCERALERLSGTPAVCAERISFKRTSSGNLNIVIDGKGTSCFIDKQKRIGSSDKGGPTIWQWVNWYHRDHKKTYAFLKEYLPEVFDGRK